MWYVIQTTTGKEQDLVDLVGMLVPAEFYGDCFIIKRQLLKRLGGKWVETVETLFPSYVFLDTEAPEQLFYELKRIPEYAKILGNNEGEFIAIEEDEKRLLKKMYQGSPEHLVRLTKLNLNENGGIEAMNGPLQYFKQELEQVNLRKRYAVIKTFFRGREQTILLGICF